LLVAGGKLINATCRNAPDRKLSVGKTRKARCGT